MSKEIETSKATIKISKEDEENPIKEYKTLSEKIINFIKNKYSSVKLKNIIDNKLINNVIYIKDGTEIKYINNNNHELEENISSCSKVAYDFGISLADAKILIENNKLI